MLLGKEAYLWNAVGNRAADGVEALKIHLSVDALAYFFGNATKFLHRLGGLRIEENVARVVDFIYFVDLRSTQRITISA